MVTGKIIICRIGAEPKKVGREFFDTQECEVVFARKIEEERNKNKVYIKVIRTEMRQETLADGNKAFPGPLKSSDANLVKRIKRILKATMNHLERHGWFYGAIIQLIGSVVLGMLDG